MSAVSTLHTVQHSTVPPRLRYGVVLSSEQSVLCSRSSFSPRPPGVSRRPTSPPCSAQQSGLSHGRETAAATAGGPQSSRSVCPVCREAGPVRTKTGPGGAREACVSSVLISTSSPPPASSLPRLKSRLAQSRLVPSSFVPRHPVTVRLSRLVLLCPVSSRSVSSSPVPSRLLPARTRLESHVSQRAATGSHS